MQKEKKKKLDFFFGPQKDDPVEENNQYMKFSMENKNVNSKVAWKKISELVLGRHKKVITKLKKAKNKPKSSAFEARMTKFFQNGFLNVRAGQGGKKKSSAQGRHNGTYSSSGTSMVIDTSKFNKTVLGNKVPH